MGSVVERGDLTQSLLKQYLHYNKATGEWTRIKGVRGSSAGSRVGSVTKDGYLIINFFHKLYLAHRLAFFYVKGYFPEGDIDHKDFNGLNNRWRNLRDTTVNVNMQNLRGAKKTSSTGLLGVVPRKGRPKNPFTAQIVVDGKTRCLGVFGTAQEAHEAYMMEKRRLHPGSTLAKRHARSRAKKDPTP